MPSGNLFGSAPSPVGVMEKMLGPAYHQVRIVASHIDTIKAIANNMSAVIGAAANMARSIQLILGEVGELGSTTQISLPAEVSRWDVLDSAVLLVASDSAIYSESSGHFSTKIVDDNLEITLSATAPATLANADVRWTLSFKV